MKDESLDKVKKEYPRIISAKVERRLKKKLCPRCGRKLHKAITGMRDTFYCTCNVEFIIF